MRRKIVISIILMVLIVVVFGLANGGKRSDVYLLDYLISEDGTKMTVSVGVASSMGYVRSVKVKQGGDYKYLTFYSTFGLNNKLGAKDEFEIDLTPTCDGIYFYSGDGGYQLQLERNAETNEWNEIN